MRNKQIIRCAGYLACLGLILALALWMINGALPSAPERYVSVHQPADLPPMFGLSAESLVNTGDAKALDVLPGVGEIISQRIVDTREAIGGFRLPEDLMLVKGIGEKTFEKIMKALDEPLVLLPEMSD